MDSRAVIVVDSTRGECTPLSMSTRAFVMDACLAWSYDQGATDGLNSFIDLTS